MKQIMCRSLFVALIFFIGSVRAIDNNNNFAINANARPADDTLFLNGDKNKRIVSLNEFLREDNNVRTMSTTPATMMTTTSAQTTAFKADPSIAVAPASNEYQSFRHAIDGLSHKMETYNGFYLSEITLLTNIINSLDSSLKDLKTKLQAIEVLNQRVDDIENYRSVTEQRLFEMKQDLDNARNLEYTVNRLRSQIDILFEKIRQSNVVVSEKGNTDGPKISADESSADANANCETKLDHLIAFVHNLAEINRIESSDILNQLNNMQTRLIDLFETKRERSKASSHEKQSDNVIHDGTLNPATQSLNNWKYEQFNGNATNEITRNARDTLSTHNQSGDRRSKRNPYNRSQCRKMLAICNHTAADERAVMDQVEIDGEHFDTTQVNAKYGQSSQQGCHQFRNVERADGVYRFNSIVADKRITGRSFDKRLCSFDRNGLAWTVIQQRGQADGEDYREDFNRSWTDYKNGFGSLTGDFWYGNDFIHRLTYDDDMELKIVIDSWDQRHQEFEYEVFRVDSERHKYNLVVNGYRGQNKTLNAMAYHNNQDFSTFDRQNDNSGIDGKNACCSCATSYASGWWFNNCIEANLNGVYQNQPLNNNFIGIIWEQWLGDYSLKSTRMMIRPKIAYNELPSDENDGNSRPPADP